MRHLLISLLICPLILTGCFKRLGGELAEGLTDEIHERRDSLSADLGVMARGVRDSLLSPETQRRVDSLTDRLGKAAVYAVTAARDSVIGVTTEERLDSLLTRLGERGSGYLAGFRDTLLGNTTTTLLQTVLKRRVLDSLSSVGAALRYELLGAPARAAVDTLVTTAVGSIGRAYRDSVRPFVREEEDRLALGIKDVLWTGGVIVTLLLLLGGYIYVRARRYRKLLSAITVQIDRIPEQATYDELVGRISASSKRAGVEKQLRTVLKETGILGKETWRPSTG